MTDTKPHALYRFYSDQGQLLYVGITKDPAKRIEQHGDQKDWWSQVSGMTIEWYPDRATVLAAERRAIRVEHPAHNIQHTPRARPGVTSQAGPRTKPAIHLVWTCNACGRPVNDGDGYIHVSYAELGQYERDKKAWEEKWPGEGSLRFIPASAYFDFPHQVRWRTHHAACDPNPDSYDYWIDVERVRSNSGLLARTAHLMGKRWLKNTNWDTVILAKASTDA